MTDRMKPDHLGLPSDDGVVCTSLECWCWRTAHGFCAKKPKPQHMTPPASPESEPETFDALVERCASLRAKARGFPWVGLSESEKNLYYQEVRFYLQAAGVERLWEEREKLGAVIDAAHACGWNGVDNSKLLTGFITGLAERAEKAEERICELEAAARAFYEHSARSRVFGWEEYTLGRTLEDVLDAKQDSGQPASPPSAEPSDTAGPAVGAGCSSPIDPAERRHRELLVALFEATRLRDPSERGPATGESITPATFVRRVKELAK